MKSLIRNAHISIAVAVTLMLAVFIPFHDSDGAMEAVTYAAFAIGLGLLGFLNGRDDRARAKREHRPN